MGRRLLSGLSHRLWVDLDRVPPNAIVVQSIPVFGAEVGDLKEATAVMVSPGAQCLASGLVVLNAYPSASGVVDVVIKNTKKSPVTVDGEMWTIWIVK
jgi:hypothetical protein